MAMDKHDEVIRKLKTQIALLKKREEQSRRELKSALCKASKLGKIYKNKLAKEARVLKNKIASAEAAAYVKAAVELERSLMQRLKSTIEKSDLAKMVKGFLGVRSKTSRKRKK